ncbi:ATP-binding protein [Phycicoccus sp. MAQZ13P-2]|uniref:AAA family ATPase n=1 Tax=Phycicoccus mangrovi TaxID=2840470 RepID=UPI001C005711|nr:AAA family ATPase [Phycicoccus mangrovi]MBT9257312.1 ATP-binding protein [Phycicoccus mangrovi]MBT9273399.1 ATP-binding protein [Phycicoccus mangrovi]
MRIVVSGTHATGKSTLVADLAAALPGHTVLGDPWELVDEHLPPSSAESFVAQLHVAADRLLVLDPGERVVVERGPLDLLAYLEALRRLGRGGVDEASTGLRSLARRAHAHVDLLVVVPLAGAHGLHVPDEEDPELREAADTALLDLLDDDELLPASTTVLEVGGDPRRRLADVLARLPH